MSGSSSMLRAHQARSACDLCRLRKIRCDWTAPSCETCSVVGVECTFTERPANARKTIREKLVEAEARMQELQDTLSRERVGRQCLRETSTPSPRFLSTPGRDETVAAFRRHLSLSISSSTLPAHAKSIVDVGDVCHDLCREIQSQYPTGAARTATMAKWPSRLLVERSINYYCNNGLYSVFPVVRSEVLTQTLNSGVLDSHGGSGDAASLACLSAFTALITNIRADEPAFVDAEPRTYAQAALTVLPELAIDHANPRTVEALVWLALYIAPMGHPQTAELLLSMAIRILFNLGSNKRHPAGNTPREVLEHEDRRALFWLCYAMDKEMSFRKRQPSMINDRDCDLDLPATYVSASSSRQFFTSPLLSHELLYPSDLRLSLLKSKVYEGLYSVQSLTLPEVRRLQLIRELDHELGHLKSHFPLAGQPDAFVNGRVPDSLIHDLSLRGVSVHLEYYHCLATIHGASSVGNTSAAPGQLPLSSSMEICYQASRPTLLYVNQVRHLIIPENFWIYAQFILTAVLSLYWRLLTDPTNSTAGYDIHILEDTSNIFTRLKSTPTGGRFLPFVIIEAFIRRLISKIHQSRGS